MSDIDFHLVATGVVTGHVLGEGNEPHAGTTVAALSLHYVRGQQRLAIDAVALTNDLGEYRLFGLRPDRYYLAAFEPNRYGTVQLPKGAPPEERYGISFYPNALDAAKASTINVQPGSELNGAEIYLMRHRTFRLRGRMMGVDRSAQGASVRLEPLLSGAAINVGGQETSPDDRGIFEFGSVLPGQYVISAGFTSGGKPYRAWQQVEIEDSDLNSVSIMPSAGITIQGRTQLPDRKEADLHSISLKFHPTFSSSMGVPAVRPTTDGSFAAYVSSDIYNLEISTLPDDAYVESARIADQDATDGIIDLSRFASGWTRMEVTLNPNGGRVDGAVENEKHEPVSAATVLLFPDDANSRKQMHLFQAINTDKNGRFSIRGIVPGDYKLLAWEDVETGAWENSEFLTPYEDRGEKITIKANAHETRTLEVIPAASGQL